jgi:GNAT superfamily N-acetyltransferase
VCGVGLLTRSGDLNLCYVRPGAQGLGIGRAILESLEEQARSWGVSEVRVLSSIGAREFYGHHGYVADGAPRPAYGVVHDIPYRKRL